MQKPWIAATVGQGNSAMRWKACCPRRIESTIVPFSSKAWNSRMSAPAMKPLALAERITRPLGGSSAMRSTSASSSISTSCENVLTDSPARSKDSTTTPSGRASACQWLKRRPSSPAIMGAIRYGTGEVLIIPILFRRRQISLLRPSTRALLARRAATWLVACAQRPQIGPTCRWNFHPCQRSYRPANPPGFQGAPARWPI